MVVGLLKITLLLLSDSSLTPEHNLTEDLAPWFTAVFCLIDNAAGEDQEGEEYMNWSADSDAVPFGLHPSLTTTLQIR